MERSREEIIYDYLEGRLDAAEQGKLEAELAASPELNKKVGEQREFLRLLHSMTGKISLSAGQVAEKMTEVYDALQDYSQTIEETFISDNRAQTLAVRTWFKKPNWQKVEAEHPQLGKMVNITKDNELITYQDKLPKAVRSKVSEDFLHAAGQDFRLTLREITTNHTTVLLGSESIEGRNCYHLKLTQAAPGDAGKVITHIWIDKATWMPLLTEQYNSKGDLTQRKAVRNLSINTGLPDSLFELPAGVEIEELRHQEITAPREVSLEEAQREMPFAPFLLTDQSLILHKCQIVMVRDTPVLLQYYHLPGNPAPEATLSQGLVPHTSLPPGIETKRVQIGGTTGEYIAMEVLGVRGLVAWQKDEVYLTLGGNGCEEDILRWAYSLRQD